ncbi:MAG: rod shape-determining protein MreD [Pseudomonadota bacterium]
MVDPVAARLWGYRGLFAALVVLLVFFRLLPLNTVPGGLPGPDLILALTFAWVLRRPAYVPAPLIVALFLLCDLLFQQPPGLWALLVLLGSEFLRARQALSRSIPFFLEWAMVSIVMVLMVVADQLVRSIFLLDTPAVGQQGIRTLFTVGIYPFVVLFTSSVLAIRKASPDEASALGARL